MKISLSRIIGLLYLAFGFVLLGLFLKYLTSPSKELLGDVFLEDMLWFIPSYLLLAVGLLSLYGSKLSLKIATYALLLFIAPSIVLTFAYLGRNNEWGFGGTLFFSAIMYGIPSFLISGISAFLLNKESNKITTTEKFQGFGTILKRKPYF